ncbi:hypothetical protein M8C21_002699 [Ambrosia artemisiifolia]|uniref:Uncharacterized protein n=1 Tax=Ambrosia artemisiifolia TaxID=4212 RepID=A0AAD5D9V9_AMBAR|nr:hypothetical protein M8C21_002699 [Ambrosia artemisiifolia]
MPKCLEELYWWLCWRVWKARNNLIFEEKKLKIAEVILDIKSID